MTGIEAVSMNLKLSKHPHLERLDESFCISLIMIYLSSILRLVIAMSMSLDSRAKPVNKEPKSTILGSWSWNISPETW